MQQPISIMNCARIDFALKIFPKQENRDNSSQVSVQARKLEAHIRVQSIAQDNIRITIYALYCYYVMECRHVETTRKCLLNNTSSSSPLKCVQGKLKYSRSQPLVGKM